MQEMHLYIFKSYTDIQIEFWNAPWEKMQQFVKYYLYLKWQYSEDIHDQNIQHAMWKKTIDWDYISILLQAHSPT